MCRAPAEGPMFCARMTGRVPLLIRNPYLRCTVLLGLVVVCASAYTTAQGTTQQGASQPATKPSTAAPNGASTDVSHGKKLILKDGTYQVVREYTRTGDRVRYFSEERGDWEELPASMVDWDATAKEEAANQKAFNAMADKIHQQEEAKRMDNVADIAASLQVGQGAFLPEAEGLYVVEGKSVRVVEQAGAGVKRDKMRTLEQVLSPVPIVPGKQNVFLPGEHAKLRLTSTSPEFYLREAPPDPDDPNAGPISRSGRPGESGPDVVLIRAKMVHKGRELESIGTFFGERISTNRDEIALQRWEVAPRVYRFTLGEALTPGEYVIAEVLEDGLNYFVWDFGMDGNSGDTAKKK
jgi:hypothetical protein